MTTLKKGFIGFLALMAFIPATLHAIDDGFYYQLGGGDPITRPATNRDSLIGIKGAIEWNTDLMCGNFDLSLSVRHQLNGLSGDFQNMMGDVIQSATGAVASLPALVIQKLNPPLYDLLQNGTWQATREFNLAKQNCQTMVGYMDRALDSTGWLNIAKAQKLAEISELGTEELLAATKEADEKGGNGGFTWVGGAKKGGEGQAPMKYVEDIAKAGYNAMLNRSPTNTTSTAATCAGAGVCQIWPNPQAHADWLVDVLGDWKHRTCNGCPRVEGQPGMGLASKIGEDTQRIEEAMTQLVASSKPPTQAQLDAISGGPALRVTRRVVESIREERPEDRAPLIRRIAGEMALSLNMERALMARRTFQAGRKEPNIANYDEAQEYLDRISDELNTEIDNLLYEMEVRKQIARNTPSKLLQRDHTRRVVPVAEPQQRSTLKGGAIHE